MTDQGYLPFGMYMNGDPESWIPPSGHLISWMRDSWDMPIVCRREELGPYMNVMGLNWKLTGIAKELGK